jgi:hypothetical protein
MIFDLEEVDESKAKEVKNVKLVKRKLLIEIEDTGIGIKNEDLSKLFKYFGKLKDTQSINKKGTGLGLNISRRIVQSMGGEISISSELKKGTKFSIYVMVGIKNEFYQKGVEDTEALTPFAQSRIVQNEIKKKHSPSIVSYKEIDDNIAML